MATHWVSIPCSAFAGESEEGPFFTHGNISGTARSFHVQMFAPAFLPDGARVTSFRAGAKARFNRQIEVTLRRNEPQQANVDMATVETSLEGTGFEFVGTTQIKSPVVDNSRFNYYVVALVRKPNEFPNVRTFCQDEADGSPGCLVGFCRIGCEM
jgi:hypothetical protein